MHFNIAELVWAVLGAYAIYSGVSKYKSFQNTYMYKYTKESILKFAKIYCACLCSIGIFLLWGAVIYIFRLPYILVMVNVVLMFMAGVIVFIAYKKVLKDK